MPQELPGFYFDPEKNRYFSLKGQIPGTFRKPPPPPPQKPVSPPAQGESPHKNGLSKLLHNRELYGSIINVSSRKRNFEEEYRKKFVSKPKVWSYQDDKINAHSLSLLNINVDTPEGQYRTDALLTGGDILSLFDIGNLGEHFNHGENTTAHFIWPKANEADCSGMSTDIRKFSGSAVYMPSTISCISMPRRGPFHEDTGGAAVKHALITTLGSELRGGALSVLNLADPVNFSNINITRRLRTLTSLNCTIWGADFNCSGNKAVVGTNLGATLVNLETAVPSVICRSKSDVLSVQLLQSGNIALCGLRNGAIVTLDVRRQNREMARHRITHPSCDSTRSRIVQRTSKPWFTIRGNVQPSCTTHMPSSICCLEALQTYDQYFLASSMDGSIRLFDHRLTTRGPVQSYEGHVNSHSHIKLATDASERFVMSGGEDCKMRIWSIKSGELLFEEKLSDSIPLTSCWQGNGGFSNSADQMQEDCHGTLTRNWDAWVGSAEGLLRMQFPG